MAKQRRTFSTEFKLWCFIKATALCRWVELLEQERGGVTPKAKALTPEQQRIQELEARVKGWHGKKRY